jgi:hypothetical protein
VKQMALNKSKRTYGDRLVGRAVRVDEVFRSQLDDRVRVAVDLLVLEADLTEELRKERPAYQ